MLTLTFMMSRNIICMYTAGSWQKKLQICWQNMFMLRDIWQKKPRLLSDPWTYFQHSLLRPVGLSKKFSQHLNQNKRCKVLKIHWKCFWVFFWDVWKRCPLLPHWFQWWAEILHLFFRIIIIGCLSNLSEHFAAAAYYLIIGIESEAGAPQVSRCGGCGPVVGAWCSSYTHVAAAKCANAECSPEEMTLCKREFQYLGHKL